MDFSENDLIFRHALIMRAAFYFGEKFFDFQPIFPRFGQLFELTA